MKRRNFLQAVAGGLALSACAGGTGFASDSAEAFSLETPFDGAVFHERCGAPVLGAGKDPDGR